MLLRVDSSTSISGKKVSGAWRFDSRTVGSRAEIKCPEKTLTSICDALDEERRLTVRALSERFDMSKGAVCKGLTKQLKHVKGA